jgi:hypothetical protein
LEQGPKRELGKRQLAASQQRQLELVALLHLETRLRCASPRREALFVARMRAPTGHTNLKTHGICLSAF